MKITETYKNNIKAIEKYIKGMAFTEDSEERIRKFINNPLDIVNDNIKALFRQYDDYVVDYRIELPSSMMEKKNNIPEVSLVMATIVQILCEEKSFTYDTETGEFSPNIEISEETVSRNYFRVGNEKRKVWKFIDSKVNQMALDVLAKETAYIAASRETSSVFSLEKYFPAYVDCFNRYRESLNGRQTSLLTKIEDFLDVTFVLNNKSESSNTFILRIAEEIKKMFNIMQEIISAKTVDIDKFKMFLSFNVFDWLLASSGESFHSCIDMNSQYCYGLGLLGMCACPDWGMFLYTDGTTKKFDDIETYHIVSRSWAMYTENKKFNLIGWYPKDIRQGVKINEDPCEGISIVSRKEYGVKSMSEWDPIVHRNGALAWIYSDSPRFIRGNKHGNVKFKIEDAPGIPRMRKEENGDLSEDYYGLSNLIQSVKYFGTISDCVNKKHDIFSKYREPNQVLVDGYYREEYEEEEERYYCDCCGDEYDSTDDLYWIDDEEIYVCNSCLEENYFYCDSCDCYVNNNHSVEVYFGKHDWDYVLVCESCADSTSEIYFDCYSERMYNSDRVPMVLVATRDESETKMFSEYSINKALDNGEIEELEESIYVDGSDCNYRFVN